MSLKSIYANKILNKKFKDLKRDISVFNFEKAKNIGILWHIDDKEAFKFMEENLDIGKISLTSLCFRGNNKEEIPGSFSEKETNWLGFPKTEHVKGFIQTEFDLLINVSLINSFAMVAVSALSKARFKIGVTDGFKNYFDLSIDVSKNPNSLYLAEQQLFYLKELKINN